MHTLMAIPPFLLSFYGKPRCVTEPHSTPLLPKNANSMA
ncbi:hypothetical protein JCM19237_3597 [Photobacterium aphoticum]|uniref:Uncharacterized protein n=1 Tax=Photobacterium aphoticum TaxID=754436 RepID=A0A090QTN9_9GAMM|nr:hypothetical protein JCM19237_3597 [Photobacterium aphoticum]